MYNPASASKCPLAPPAAWREVLAVVSGGMSFSEATGPGGEVRGPGSEETSGRLLDTLERQEHGASCGFRGGSQRGTVKVQVTKHWLALCEFSIKSYHKPSVRWRSATAECRALIQNQL